ncbi:MAG: copper amine oxidase N-terminal domain-containing protein [Armatimonadota bacterium]
MHNLKVAVILLIMLLVFISSAYAADNVNVTVNGTQVQFRGVGAQVIGGRVLVPLRGVLEQMGAFVGWDAPSRTVIVQRGDRDVQLPIGSETAKVNGQTIKLDVPALIISGTTMVPLRFVGETLGADVKWDGATRTVAITSQTTPTDGGTTPTPPAGPEIQSFTHNSTGWLTAGDKLSVVLRGTPGGSAGFEVPGVTGKVPMKEVSSGRYEAVWTVPSDTNSVSGAGVFGQLTVNGKNLMIQSGTSVSIDVNPPAIKNTMPQPGSSIAQRTPGISATFDDGSGSGIDPSSFKLTVNGKDITNNLNVTSTFASYIPDKPLDYGIKTISIAISDKAGNTAKSNWEFTIKEASLVIKSVTFNAPENAGPGDVISVRLEGEKGGNARFWFATPSGTKLNERSMSETSPGIYTGEYTIRRSDNLTGSTIVGSLTTAGGDNYILEASSKFGGQPAQLSPPQITAPVDGGSASSPLVITGKASPGAQVHISVSYVSSILGALKVTGALTDQTITANDQGIFTTEPIDLGTMLGSKDTEYTLTAVTVGTEGNESLPTVVKFKRK